MQALIDDPELGDDDGGLEGLYDMEVLLHMLMHFQGQIRHQTPRCGMCQIKMSARIKPMLKLR